MIVHNICIAPTGKFRVVEIDEKEKRHSTIETDYTIIIKDCDSLQDAKMIMKEVKEPNTQRLIYDDLAECLGNFRYL